MKKTIKLLFGILVTTIGIIIISSLIVSSLVILDIILATLKALSSGVNIQTWLVKSFDINPNTATSIIASFSVFLAGILTNWTTQFVTKIRDRLRYRKILSNYSRTLSFAMVKKSGQFKVCADTMDVRKKENFTMSDMALTHLDNIQKIDVSKFDNAFFQGIENLGRIKLHNKAYDNIFSVVSNVKRIEELYVSQFDNFISRYNVLAEKRNIAIMKVKEIIDKLQDDANGKNVPNDIPVDYFQYLSGIRQIVSNWNNIDNNTLPSIFDEHFIQKLRNHNIAFNDSVRVRPFIPNSLYYAINDADNEYQSMKILVETNNKIFLNYSLSYKNQSRKLFDSIVKLNQYPILKLFS
jgi:hypothetical protein